MPSPYQEFARKARERFEARKKSRAATGTYQFTTHAQYKMQQYGLSEQKIRNVIRNPRRREEGIVPKTVAVMQPVSTKNENGKEVWKQEVWVMFQKKKLDTGSQGIEKSVLGLGGEKIKIISAWRYPGISPKRNPVPAEILREIETGDILDADEMSD